MDAKTQKSRDEWVANLDKHIKECVEKDLLKRPAPREDLSTTGGLIDFDCAEIELGEQLGSGASGCIVNKCTINGKTCAVKILPLFDNIAEVVDAFVNEIKIVEQLHHSNIVGYWGHCQKDSPRELWLFMDFYPSSLQGYLQSRTKCLPRADIIFIALSIAKGIEFLHTLVPPIVHRDLKSGNILLSFDEDGVVKSVKITDFDTAKIIYSDVHLNTTIGTPCYMAPEVMDISLLPPGATYSLKADIYSFGMIMVELLTLHPPYDEVQNMLHLANKIVSGELPAITHPNLDELQDIVELIKQCAAKHPEKRWEAGQVVKILKKMLRDIPFSELAHLHMAEM